jgi:hypothetical protein
MSKVLIAARIMAWGTIALSLCSCNSNSPPTPNAPVPLSQAENSPVAPTSTVGNASVPDSRSQLAPTLTSSPLQSTTATNVRLEQVNDVAALPKISPHPNHKQQERDTSISPTSCPAFPCLILTPDASNLQNRFNNPIYKLTAYLDKTSTYLFQFDAVTGRGFTQHRNRYKSNTEAPLPNGSYLVASRVVTGTLREVGGTMVPIFPKPVFDPRMRRTALGIHWDPSFDRDKKEDGTSGCIGLTNKHNYHQVRDFILKYHPRSLEVKITH